jgi:hypothetical protein
MPKKDNNSNNNTKARRRLNYAETLRCTVAASSVTPAHTHMVLTSFRRRHISQATSWQSFAPNSTEMVSAGMVKDANSYTVSTTSRPNWLTAKHSRKVPDLLSKETPKSAVTLWLTASGPTWRLAMVAVHQKDHVLHASKRFITKTHYKRTWDKSKKKMLSKETKFKWTTSNNTNNQSHNHNKCQWWNHAHTTTTKTWTWTSTICHNPSFKATKASMKSSQWTTYHQCHHSKGHSLHHNRQLPTQSLNHSSDRAHEKA